MKAIKRFKKWWKEKQRKKELILTKKNQKTFIYCTCGNELAGSGSFLSDDEDGVKYQCTQCKRVSLWNFDLAPVPLDITDGKYPSPKEMGLEEGIRDLRMALIIKSQRIAREEIEADEALNKFIEEKSKGKK